MKITSLLVSALFFLKLQLLCGQCPNNAVNLTSQLQVDNFNSNYPGCTNITNDLSISGNTITNLNGLSGLTQINSLVIENTGSLTTLTGLNNVTTIGGVDIKNNSALTTIDGLNGVSSIDVFYLLDNPFLNNLTALGNLLNIAHIEIYGNHSLNDLNGLQGLSSIDLYFSISNNNSLTSLSGLENLNFVGDGLDITNVEFRVSFNANLSDLSALQNLNYVDGRFNISFNPLLNNLLGLESLSFVRDLDISSNATLQTFDGLQGLTNVENHIRIYNNQILTSLEGLNNLNSIPIENTAISSNPNLSYCTVSGICNILNVDPSLISISGNLSGCANNTEVTTACQNPCSLLQDHLIVNNDPILPGVYQSKLSLSSSGHIYSGLTGTNAVKFYAKDIIELLNSFEVEIGSHFEIMNVDSGCP